MQIIDNTAEPSNVSTSSFKAEITDYGTAPKAEATIAPEDQHYVDRILAMDQLKDVPGVAKVPEGRVLARPTLEALSPEMRAEVVAQMQGLTPEARDAKESELVEAAIRKRLPSIRVMTGLGENALPFHREMVAIAREVHDLDREFQRITKELQEVRQYRNEVDPVTGKSTPQPVYAVQGQRRAAMEFRLRDIVRHIDVLDDGGIESEQRKRKALAESVAILKERDRQANEERDARALGAEKARKARVEAKADLYARLDPYSPANQ